MKCVRVWVCGCGDGGRGNAAGDDEQNNKTFKARGGGMATEENEEAIPAELGAFTSAPA